MTTTVAPEPQDPRSEWQQEALDTFMALGRRDFLITACPGAGKTRCALQIARALLDARKIDQVLILAPTVYVAGQWSKAGDGIRMADGQKMDITTDQRTPGAIPPDCVGMAITYQRLAQNADQYGRFVNWRRTMVIIDEVHHLGESDTVQRAWCAAATAALADASYRLALSGTPFRTDGIRIPFIEYNDAGMAVAQFELPYRKAVEKMICRPVRFDVLNGAGEWQRGATRFTAEAKTVDADDRSDLLRTLHDHTGKYIPSLIQQGHEELLRIREEEKPNAAGLIVARNIEHAKAYARLVKKITGTEPALVTSRPDADDPDAKTTIEMFADGTTFWIVAVAMISEGVDISRLAVCIHASNYLTELWFRQIVGRIIRMDGPQLTATMLIPAIPELVDMARRIEEEADVALHEQETRLRTEAERTTPIEFEVSIPLGSSAAERDSVINSGEGYDKEELASAAQYAAQYGPPFSNLHAQDVAGFLRLTGISLPVAHVRTEVPTITPRTNDQLRQNLRTQINSNVVGFAYDIDAEPRFVHQRLNAVFGSRFGDGTQALEELRKRLDMIREWRARGEMG